MGSEYQGSLASYNRLGFRRSSAAVRKHDSFELRLSQGSAEGYFPVRHSEYGACAGELRRGTAKLQANPRQGRNPEVFLALVLAHARTSWSRQCMAGLGTSAEC